MIFLFKSEGRSLEDLEQATIIGLTEIIVGESDIEVAELCGPGRQGVTVLDTGECDPEVSWHSLATVPLLAGDGHVDIWPLDGGVILRKVRGEATSVVSQLIELPSVQFVDRIKAIHGGPSNIEVLSDIGVVGSP